MNRRHSGLYMCPERVNVDSDDAPLPYDLSKKDVMWGEKITRLKLITSVRPSTFTSVSMLVCASRS